MKKSLITITSILIVLFLVSFKQTQQTVPCGNATVEKKFGVDVYAFSIPTRKYEVIKSGSDFKPFATSCESLVNNAAKQGMNLKADAIIVHLEGYSFEAIKYKD
jgi:hypothetical protein